MNDLVDRLRLIRSPTIGPVNYRQLLLRFGNAAAALDALPDLARRGGGSAPRIVPRAEAEREIEVIERLGGRYLLIGQGLYPRLLAELDSAPTIPTACRFSRGLAHDLGAEGVVTVSGLARGIDSAAHDGSLASGTIAVVAGGLDVIYPPENAERQAAIAERGLVIAEMPPGTEPRARHFPHRNRIIAGLALGTVVVEAAPRSGSLIPRGWRRRPGAR